jgi:hypothetical protein
MKKFHFTGTKIQQEYGIFVVEAESVEKALEKIRRGSCEFNPSKGPGTQSMAADLSLYLEVELEEVTNESESEK